MTDGGKTDEKLISINQAIVLNLDLVQFEKIQGSFHVGESFAM